MAGELPSSPPQLGAAPPAGFAENHSPVSSLPIRPEACNPVGARFRMPATALMHPQTVKPEQHAPHFHCNMPDGCSQLETSGVIWWFEEVVRQGRWYNK